MFTETVEIADCLNDKVKIKFTKRSMCSCCRFSSVCNRGQETLLIDRGNFSLKKGEKVEIAINERMTILAGLIVFIFPAALFTAGLLIFGERGELFSFLLALSLVCIYYILMKFVLKFQGKKFDLKIIRKIKD